MDEEPGERMVEAGDTSLLPDLVLTSLHGRGRVSAVTNNNADTHVTDTPPATYDEDNHQTQSSIFTRLESESSMRQRLSSTIAPADLPAELPANLPPLVRNIPSPDGFPEDYEFVESHSQVFVESADVKVLPFGTRLPVTNSIASRRLQRRHQPARGNPLLQC